MAATVEALQAGLSAPIRNSGSVRHADFAVRQEPYTIAASVDLPAVPTVKDSARLAVRVTLDTINLEARVGRRPGTQ